MIGFVTPAIIVNRFGMTTRDPAHAHALLGAEHLSTPEFDADNARPMTFLLKAKCCKAVSNSPKQRNPNCHGRVSRRPKPTMIK